MARIIKSDPRVLKALQNARRKEKFLAVMASLAIFVVGGAGLLLYKYVTEEPSGASFISYQVPEAADDSATDAAPKNLTPKVGPSMPDVDFPIAADMTGDFSSVDVEGFEDIESAPSVMFGSFDTGLGDGAGESSLGSSGLGSREPLPNGFCGRLWDLKKKPNGSDSALVQSSGNDEALSVESRFFNGGWNPSVFSPYFQSRIKLYTSCFFMPNAMDHEAVRAYDPEGRMKLKPCRWVAVYRAKVRAPRSGKFRFVGAGDSVLAVRFNGKNVLSCGFHDLSKSEWNAWHVISNPDCLQGREVIPYSGCEFWNEQFGGFVAGEEFTVDSEEWYDMQVMVSELGGGNFGFCLLVQDMDDENATTTEDGKPLYQLFRTSFIEPSAEELYEKIQFKDDELRVNPPYDKDSMIWEAKPVDVAPSGR